jgi:hypothetical protein
VHIARRFFDNWLPIPKQRHSFTEVYFGKQSKLTNKQMMKAKNNKNKIWLTLTIAGMSAAAGAGVQLWRDKRAYQRTIARLARTTFANEAHTRFDFPHDFLEQVVPPSLSNNPLADFEELCRPHEPPKLCSSVIECQERCGPDYECRTTGPNEQIVYNGLRLEAGVRYCVPQWLNRIEECPSHLSTTVVRFDYATREPVKQCVCTFPDLVGGLMCDEVLACLEPHEQSRTKRAKLVDRVSGRVVLDPNDDLRASPAYMERLNLDELVADPATGTAMPRYYCACKGSLNDNSVTGAVIPGRCVADPCFNGITNIPAALGLADAHVVNNSQKPQLGSNCDCGSFQQTRMLHAESVGCRALTSSTLSHDPDVDLASGRVKSIRCIEGDDHIFWKCRNNFRQGRDVDPYVSECGAQDFYHQNARYAPEAGKCILPCKECRYHASSKQYFEHTASSALREQIRSIVDLTGEPYEHYMPDYYNACSTTDMRTEPTCLQNREFEPIPDNYFSDARPAYMSMNSSGKWQYETKHLPHLCNCTMHKDPDSRDGLYFWKPKVAENVMHCTGERPGCIGLDQKGCNKLHNSNEYHHNPVKKTDYPYPWGTDCCNGLNCSRWLGICNWS